MLKCQHCWHFNIYEQGKFHAQLSCTKKSFISSWTGLVLHCPGWCVQIFRVKKVTFFIHYCEFIPMNMIHIFLVICIPMNMIHIPMDMIHIPMNMIHRLILYMSKWVLLWENYIWAYAYDKSPNLHCNRVSIGLKSAWQWRAFWLQ